MYVIYSRELHVMIQCVNRVTFSASFSSATLGNPSYHSRGVGVAEVVVLYTSHSTNAITPHLPSTSPSSSPPLSPFWLTLNKSNLGKCERLDFRLTTTDRSVNCIGDESKKKKEKKKRKKKKRKKKLNDNQKRDGSFTT